MVVSVKILKVLSDNYSFLLYNEDIAAVVDPGEYEIILDSLGDRKLLYILNTHNHFDHTYGNHRLEEMTKAKIININSFGKDAEINILKSNVEIIFLPGHSKSHIGFFFKKEKMLFSGDVLFPAGCGRVNDGKYEDMYNSLNKISRFPDETKIFFGHDYAEKNIKFAKTIEKDNYFLNTFEFSDVRISTTLAIEKKINPFLRLNVIKEKFNLTSELETFIFLRNKRDIFS